MQLVNRNVKILGKKLYSPSLKEVAWLEDAQLIFLIFHIFVSNFFPGVCRQIKPGILNLTLEGQGNLCIAFIFVSFKEKGHYYHFFGHCGAFYGLKFILRVSVL